ncbi:MAG: class I SAM-dependent methyltransferase [Oscillospiraceae bacterium]|nr:class I SAM-dependent methyltransferase [Oscillospiraceae bacterium]
MRRQALLDVVADIRPRVGGEEGKKCLEIGYGTGIFSYELYRMGFQVFGYDFSASAFNTANAVFNTDKQRLHLKRELSEADHGAYDLLVALEVLEHNEDDAQTLLGWRKLIKESGLLLLSVPARMKYFGAQDRSAGHFRRYEKSSLKTLLESCGFEMLNVVNYGFPILNALRLPARLLVYNKRYKQMQQHTQRARTQMSGAGHADRYRFHKLSPYRLLVACSKIQRIFYHCDCGPGYLVAAKKI